MDSSITNIMRSISDFVKTKVGEGRTFPRRRSCFRATGLSAIEASHPVRRCAGPTPPRPSTGLPGRGDPLEPPAKKSTPVFRGSTRAKSRNLTQAAIPSNRNLLQGRSAPRTPRLLSPGPDPGVAMTIVVDPLATCSRLAMACSRPLRGCSRRGTQAVCIHRRSRAPADRPRLTAMSPNSGLDRFQDHGWLKISGRPSAIPLSGNPAMVPLRGAVDFHA